MQNLVIVSSEAMLDHSLINSDFLVPEKTFKQLTYLYENHLLSDYQVEIFQRIEMDFIKKKIRTKNGLVAYLIEHKKRENLSLPLRFK